MIAVDDGLPNSPAVLLVAVPTLLTVELVDEVVVAVGNVDVDVGVRLSVALGRDVPVVLLAPVGLLSVLMLLMLVGLPVTPLSPP